MSIFSTSWYLLNFYLKCSILTKFFIRDKYTGFIQLIICKPFLLDQQSFTFQPAFRIFLTFCCFSLHSRDPIHCSVYLRQGVFFRCSHSFDLAIQKPCVSHSRSCDSQSCLALGLHAPRGLLPPMRSLPFLKYKNDRKQGSCRLFKISWLLPEAFECLQNATAKHRNAAGT